MKCGSKAAWHTLFLVTSQTNHCFFRPLDVEVCYNFLIKPVFNGISLEISPTLPPLATGSTFPPCWKTDSLGENTQKNDEMSLSSACCTSGTVVHPTESYSNRAMRSTIIKQNTWRFVISAVADSYWFVCIWNDLITRSCRLGVRTQHKATVMDRRNIAIHKWNTIAGFFITMALGFSSTITSSSRWQLRQLEQSPCKDWMFTSPTHTVLTTVPTTARIT